MKANELRIGNWVKDDRDRLVTIHGIESNWNYVWLNYANGHAIYCFEKERIQPIPLTPEVLEKCGFEYDGKLYVIDKEKYHTFSILLGEICHPYIATNHHEVSERFSLYGIKYLHQLQNLYFALTGEELNYTP